jgi:hypothetical protein
VLPRALALAALALGMTFVPSAARAQEQDDVVHLQNGGRVRGRVVEHDPDGTTTVMLATGDSRTFSAGDVASVDFAAAEEVGAQTPSVRAWPAAELTRPLLQEERPASSEPALRLRGGAWILGGTFAGRLEWQGTFLAGGGVELALPARIRLRAEGVVGWEGPAGSSGVPAGDVARLGLRLGVGVAALEWLELRTFGGIGMWLGFAGDDVAVAGTWEIGERIVVHLPPGDHLELGLEITWHGAMSGTTNPFGFGLFFGFVI